MTSRRDVIKAGAMAAIARVIPSSVTLAGTVPEQPKLPAGSFWCHLRLYADGGRRAADQRSRKPYAKDRSEVSISTSQ